MKVGISKEIYVWPLRTTIFDRLFLCLFTVKEDEEEEEKENNWSNRNNPGLSFVHEWDCRQFEFLVEMKYHRLEKSNKPRKNSFARSTC